MSLDNVSRFSALCTRDGRALSPVAGVCLLFEQTQHAHDTIERCADLVPHHREELRLRPVGGLGLVAGLVMGMHLGHDIAGALGHRGLEVFAQPLRLGRAQTQHVQGALHPADLVVAGLGDVAAVIAARQSRDVVRDVGQPRHCSPAHQLAGNDRRRDRRRKRGREANGDPPTQPRRAGLAGSGRALHPVEQPVGPGHKRFGPGLKPVDRRGKLAASGKFAGFDTKRPVVGGFRADRAEQPVGLDPGARRWQVGRPGQAHCDLATDLSAQIGERGRVGGLVDPVQADPDTLHRARQLVETVVGEEALVGEPVETSRQAPPGATS